MGNNRQIEQEATSLLIFGDGQMTLKLPHHAGDDLEPQTGARLVDVEPLRKALALI